MYICICISICLELACVLLAEHSPCALSSFAEKNASVFHLLLFCIFTGRTAPAAFRKQNKRGQYDLFYKDIH